jgi:protein O-mannosyl-transferase
MAIPKKQPLKKMVPVSKEPVRTKPQQPKGPFHFSGRKFNIIFILSVIVLCFVLYGNSIPNEFALDDEFVLHNDTIVAKGISGIPELFQTRYAWDQKGGYGYRPMVKVTFALEYTLFKDSPHWGHFINILLYAFVCIFLFYFFRKLLYNQWGDYFLLTVLAIYITHPIHSEVVASLKNRDEMLVLMFGLFCCYSVLKWFESEKWQQRLLWGISACLSIGCGALCKPDALVFIAITGMIMYFFTARGSRIGASVSSIILTGASILVGSKIMHNYVLPRSNYHRTFVYIENPLVGVHWYHKFPLAFSTVWFYIAKMLYPKNLIAYYGYNAFDCFPKWTDFGVIAGILLTGLLIYLVVKNLKKQNALLFFLLLFGGTLAPYTDLTQVGAGIVAERFMFIPSFAFIILVTYLVFYFLKIPLDKKPSGKQLNYVYFFTIAVCVIFAGRVIARNPDWKTHRSIYLHDSQAEPHSAKLQSLLAATYIEEAQKLKASNPEKRASIDSLFYKGETGYQNSVNIYPGYGTSWNNLGMIQYTLYGNLPNAIADFRKALKIDSDYTEALFNMGACYSAIADKINDTVNKLRHDSALAKGSKMEIDEARQGLGAKIKSAKERIHLFQAESERSYMHAIRLKPGYYMAYIYLSRLYFSEGRYDKVIEFDKNALENGNKSDVIYVTLGNAYLMQKDTNDAVYDYEQSMHYYTKNFYVCNFLKKYYFDKGDKEKARYYKQLYDSAMAFRNRSGPQR